MKNLYKRKNADERQSAYKRKLCLIIGIVLLLLLLMLLSGCGEDDAETAENELAGTEQALDDEEANSEDEDIDVSALGGDGVDVDLSKLSATMVYSVVNDMMMRPDEYLGKMIRMKGSLSCFEDEETGGTYYACIIEDATACCAQGIEFQTTDEFDPADYPEEGEEVTVSGRYELYEENGYQYYVLKEAVLE